MALCSPPIQPAFDRDGRFRPEILATNVTSCCAAIARAADTHGAKLIAFPQFGLTGYASVGADAWVEASVTFPGAELDRIGEAARQAGAYVLVQTPERHPAFPGRYFLSAAILTPAGEIGLVHRKNYAMSLRTSPIDVYDRFVATFGSEAFFPVLATPLGKIGVAIGAEVNWPEPIRALALAGAEIVLNPVAAAPSLDYLLNRPAADSVRSVRAFENLAYLGMVNIAAPGAPRSQVFDFHGTEIQHAPGTPDPITLATLDIAALRAARQIPTANFIAQIQPALHAPLADLPLWPANAFADAPPADFDALVALQASVWQHFQARDATGS